LAGGALLAAIVIFAIPIDNGLTGVFVLLAIPVGFAAGAMLARDGAAPPLRRLPSRWVVALILTTTAALTVGSLAASEINPRDGSFHEADTAVIGADPIDLFGDGWLNRGGTMGALDPVAIHEVSLSPEPANLLDGWHDLRLEAWPAAGPLTHNLAPTAEEPAMTVPMMRNASGTYTAELDLGVYKETRWYVFAMTGVAPDGLRYRLGGPDTAVPSRPWIGTVWEYLTGP
jgi:hypothetical protein